MASRSAIVFLLGLALAAAGCDRQRPGDGQATAAHNDTSPDEVQPASKKHGAHNAVDRHQRGMAAVDSVFISPEGKRVRLADFRGKPVLLNLWATWCAPCRAEMPALDALQKEKGGNAFEVVAVNVDTGDDTKPKKFLKEIGVETLGFYRDPTIALFNEAKTRGLALGLPVTMLIDAEGCLIAHMNGPAEWSSPDAKRLVDAALAP